MEYAKIENEGICAYCGGKGRTTDHFIPSRLVNLLQDISNLVNALYLIPCCMSCNSALSCIIVENVEDKIKYVNTRHRNRRKRGIYSSNWNREELNKVIESENWSIDKNPNAAGLSKVKLELYINKMEFARNVRRWPISSAAKARILSPVLGIKFLKSQFYLLD